MNEIHSLMMLNSRQQREKERRRQQIIAASKRVFSFKGFSRATVKDIAEEAELSPGTIYIYFKNKDELYAALSIRMLKHLKVRLQRVKEMEALDPDQRIEAVKQALCDVYEVDPPMFITLFHLQASETLENISERLLDQIIDLSQDSLNTLADIFAQGIRRGSYSPIAPSKLSLILWSLFSGMIVWEESKRSLDPQKDFLKPTLDTAFEIFSRGIMRKRNNQIKE